MQVIKGTKCFLSEYGHYNIAYMSDNISEFNTDCFVELKPFLNPKNKNYFAVQTEIKNIGVYEQNNQSSIPIIVWISN